jgi:general stress protein YciG
MASKEESKGNQGFASMDEEQLKAVASKGGKSSGKAESKAEDTESKAKSSKGATSTQAESDEEADTGEELDELLQAFEEGDLTAIDLEDATEMIEEWQGTLSKSKDAGLKEVGNSLKQLKKSLSGGKAKAEDLAELFAQLGEQVDNCADNAERGYKTKMHSLGRAFKKAAKSLEQSEE